MRGSLLWNIINVFVIGMLITAVCVMTFLPWWSFVVVCFIYGVLLSLLKFDLYFFVGGFVAGILSWSGATFLFSYQSDSNVLVRVAPMVGLSELGLIIIAGLVCGVLTGLSVYCGGKIIRGSQL